jgi:BolA protein
MTRRDELEALLNMSLHPDFLRVTDDSHKHAGHAGARPEGQTHFTVEITAPVFTGKSRVERHRLVYGALEGHFEAGLHALAIKARAPDEA